MSNEISVFFAYQFSNASLDRLAREQAISCAVNTATADLMASCPDTAFTWRRCEFQSGKQVGEQILSLIEECDIFVADVSESNPNVLFELGVAYGLMRAEGKRVIWLAHESIDLTELPSDLRGLFVQRYSEKTIESLLTKLLYDAGGEILDMRKQATNDSLLLRQLWGLQDKGYADIVCSEIPPDERPYFADPSDRNYLRYAKFADLDTLIYLKYSLARLYPGLHLRDFSPSEHYDTNTQALFVVGGPPWNATFREFQSNLPFQFAPRPLGQDDPLLVDGFEDMEFRPLWTDDESLLRDIALFARIRVGVDIPVFLFGGCLTFGVLGAAMIFLDELVGPSNAIAVDQAAGRLDFILIAEIERAGGFLRTPDLTKGEVILLLTRDDSDSSWSSCIDNTESFAQKRQQLRRLG